MSVMDNKVCVYVLSSYFVNTATANIKSTVSEKGNVLPPMKKKV